MKRPTPGGGETSACRLDPNVCCWREAEPHGSGWLIASRAEVTPIDRVVLSGVVRSSEQMLDDARTLLARKGRLTSALLDVSADTASARQYIERFGSLGKLYELVGYTPTKRQRLALERGVGNRLPTLG